MIALVANPAGTTPEQALESLMKQFNMPFDAAQVMDTDPIAGLPARKVSGDVTMGGTQYGYDFYAFANETLLSRARPTAHTASPQMVITFARPSSE